MMVTPQLDTLPAKCQAAYLGYDNHGGGLLKAVLNGRQLTSTLTRTAFDVIDLAKTNFVSPELAKTTRN